MLINVLFAVNMYIYYKFYVFQSHIMLCSRAVRNLVQKRLFPSSYWAIQNPKHLHNFSSINNRILSNEAKAVQKILSKSKLNGIQVARICGVRSFHTSHTNWNKNDDEKKKQDEDDEKVKRC